jgi:AAA+ superfamily predicted ATPase
MLATARIGAGVTADERHAILAEFVRIYGQSYGRLVNQGGWLTPTEIEIASTKPENQGLTLIAHLGMSANTTKQAMLQRWTDLIGQKRCPALRNAGYELFNMVGVTAAKELALEVVDEWTRKTKSSKKKAPRHAYIITGGEGTGKSTVARLLARVLQATDLDPESKIVNYTAREALRATAKHFSKEIASLTGGKLSSAPPVEASKFRKGMHVEVLHGSEWFAGQITKFDEKSQMYNVRYSDGTEDENITELNSIGQPRMRCVSAETTKGGVMVLDDVHLLNPSSNFDGSAILDDIIRAVPLTDRTPKTALILTASTDGYKALSTTIPELRTHFRHIHIDDLVAEELRELWLEQCRVEGWSGNSPAEKVNVSDVAARQLERQRASPSFGNGRAVLALRDAAIAAAKRRTNSGDRQLLPQDIVGLPPSPEYNPSLAAALQLLQACIGLRAVKEAVQGLCDLALSNYYKELHGQRPDAIPLNRLFLGNPGTGKTTMAAIYGHILKHMRLLSKGDVLSYTASDFMGAHVGSSEEKTKAILAAARGCVLIIDEAYNLNDGQFGKAALNTLVECVSGGPSDDIAVILVGYERDVVRMLDEQNPGLRSRFDPAYAFHFEDFTDMELLQIFGAACVRDQVEVPFDVKRAAVKVLAKQRCMKNFGNARAVMSLFSAAKSRMTQRLRADPTQPKVHNLMTIICFPS